MARLRQEPARVEERLKATKELRASEELLRQFVENVPVAVAMFDADMRYLLFSRRWMADYHLGDRDITGLSHYEVFPDIPERWKEAHRRALAGSVERCDEDRFERADGTVEWLRWEILPWRNAMGEIGGIIIFSEVITDRKRAEEERERLLKEIGQLLEAAQNRATELRTIIDSIADAVFVSDDRGVITLMNGAALKLVGLSTPETGLTLADYLKVLGLRYLVDQRPVPLDDLAIARAIRGETVRGREEVGVHPTTGQRVDLLVSAAPLRDQSGRIGGAVEVVIDVTRLRGLDALNRELAAANRELEAFSYSVSHDLRAPLRAIDGFSLSLLKGYSDRLDERGRHLLERVRAGSQRMGQLIDDMLTLSRVTRREMQWETVDLSSLAQAAVAELRQASPERRVEVHITPGLKARGDTQLLQTVLANLIGNAWKFTGERADARVEFGATRKKGEWVYYVKDNGAGFDMAYADKLFRPFQRLHSESEFPGTGIGLATVQRIVHRHGGQVCAEGEVDKGAAFYFTLGSQPEARPVVARAGEGAGEERGQQEQERAA